MNEAGRKRIILGSQSPQRRELLQLLLPDAEIDVVVPKNFEEPRFPDRLSLRQVETHLSGIARGKNDNVAGQLDEPYETLITADTVIVAPLDEGLYRALEKPPAENATDVVREWFTRYYLGQTHLAMSAVCVRNAHGIDERIVTTRVTMRSASDEELDFYLQSGESVGKAGGYAIQGLGSLFVTHVEGSLTNVVGLPLCATRELLR